ncbi:MAG TPA: AgmX/PglI C-terminal domain-containing protein [Candidatus Binatia bacterium]|nr:AgmX/PglI C-terminal domain-containing protein [Candidatus Binatia bacterium]
MSIWRLQQGAGRFGFLCFLLIAVCGCGGSHEEPPATPANAPGRSAVEAPPLENKAGQPAVTLPSPTPSEEPHESPSPSLSAHASVLASKELGMVVTGMGTREPARSLEVLEQQVLSFLPQLQEVYEQEREQDPSLMGSLDVSLTIAPGGEVSNLHFPLRRVTNERLTTAVFDRMRAWSFPPADEQVQLRFRLLFVPPGVDQASIMTWEKQLGGHALVDQSEESRVATTTSATPAKKVSPRISPTVSPRPRSTEATRVAVTGRYRVVSPTVLRAAPRDSSPIVARLHPGTTVRVVSLVGGEWLEVRSVSNRPPGFLRRGDAKLDLEGGVR